MQADTYNKMFTMHGLVMIFFFLIPSIPNVLGNFLIPPDDWREGRCLPEAQPDELVCLQRRRTDVCLYHLHGWPGHPLDVLYTAQHGIREQQRARHLRNFRNCGQT